MSMPPLSFYYKNKIPLIKRGSGKFLLQDTVQWGIHIGKIVEIIPYGMYPRKEKGLRVRGYFREYESYIVQDDRGKRWWPRVGTLHLLKRKKE